MLVVVTLYISNNKKNEYQWDTVKTAFNRTEMKVQSCDRFWCKRLGFPRSTVHMWCRPQVKIIRTFKFWLKANSCKRCVTMLVHSKTRISTIFLYTNFVSLKYFRQKLSTPTENGVVVARWSLLILYRNMAKSAINKLLTEIIYGIEKLIYIRFIDKH